MRRQSILKQMKVNDKDIITVDTVEQYAALFGCPPVRHPLMSVCRLSEVKDYVPVGKPVQLNLYSVTIKDGTTCNAKYGWRDYDFSRGTMNFFAPGQIHRWDEKAENSGRWGWLLAFHPNFVRRYPLGEKIGRMRFFSYEVNEALHVSDAERNIVESILNNMESEYGQRVDAHTQDIIVSLLNTLLNYAERFYTRQFQTRNSVDSDILSRVQSIIRKYTEERSGKFISVSGIAGELGMSPHYLSDLLRALTGMNAQQHIHAYLIARAKTLLVSTRLSVSEIAYELGFEYPQHFNRLFKNKTGVTPLEYRKAN